MRIFKAGLLLLALLALLALLMGGPVMAADSSEGDRISSQREQERALRETPEATLAKSAAFGRQS